MIADSRRPDGGRRRRHRRHGARRPSAGSTDALDGADEELAPRPPCRASSRSAPPPAPGERAYGDLLVAEPAGRDPAPRRPGGAGRAALHQRHVGPPARRDAQPPGAAGQHRAGRRGRAADDHTATTWCSACCRCSTSTGSTPCSARCCASGAGWCSVDGFDPEGSLDIIEDEAVTVVPVAPPVFAYWHAVPRPRATGSARCGWCCPARRRCRPSWSSAFTARTGIAVHQGYGLTEAAPVVTSTLCSTQPQPGLGRRRAARHRDPAGRRGRARRPRARTPARSRSAARTCSPATGPTAPTARTPTAGAPPATSASSTPTATCSWSTGSRSW